MQNKSITRKLARTDAPEDTSTTTYGCFSEKFEGITQKAISLGRTRFPSPINCITCQSSIVASSSHRPHHSIIAISRLKQVSLSDFQNTHPHAPLKSSRPRLSPRVQVTIFPSIPLPVVTEKNLPPVVSFSVVSNRFTQLSNQ